MLRKHGFWIVWEGTVKVHDGVILQGRLRGRYDQIVSTFWGAVLALLFMEKVGKYLGRWCSAVLPIFVEGARTFPVTY